MPKKRRSFLDLLTKNREKEKEKKVEINSGGEELSREMPMTADESPLENKEWLAEAGDDGQLTLDVYQTDKDIIIKSTIAGVSPEDLDIAYNNGMLTIKGERKTEETIDKENYFYQELYWGSFSRSVILPADVEEDNIEAELKNGILTVRLPKKVVNHQQKIKVKAV